MSGWVMVQESLTSCIHRQKMGVTDVLPPFQQRGYVVVRVSPGLVEACARPTDHRGTSALQFLARKSGIGQISIIVSWITAAAPPYFGSKLWRSCHG